MPGTAGSVKTLREVLRPRATLMGAAATVGLCLKVCCPQRALPGGAVTSLTLSCSPPRG